MDIGASQITNIIVASTTSYMVTYSSLFILMGSIVLALGIIGALLDKFFPDRQNTGTEV
jgi:predicted membrane channel-forming protein YqfA (hemolysin III family)